MWKQSLIVFLYAGLCHCIDLRQIWTLNQNYEVYYEWDKIEFNYPNKSVEDEYRSSGKYVPTSVLASGIKIFRDKMFLSTPRYLPGVPYSLSVVPYNKNFLELLLRLNMKPKLTPFPSYEMNQEGNCFALQLVQAMELDHFGRLWVVDAGRTELFSPTGPKNLCPAKVVIFDLLKKNRIERVYEFPAEVVPRDTNAIKDIQIACAERERDNCFTYISNLNGSSLVVYDFKNNDSWYATHPTMAPDLDRANITIEGLSVFTPYGITGLGLTPKSTNYSRVYYSKIAGDHIYSVPTSVLKDGTTLKANPVLKDSDVTDLGVKSSGQTDGTAMDNKGRWFYGSLPESAVYSIDTTNNPTKLPRATQNLRNTQQFQWPDTFSFDNQGNLAFTTVRFQRYGNGKVNVNEPNYRVIRFKTNTKAYNL